MINILTSFFGQVHCRRDADYLPFAPLANLTLSVYVRTAYKTPFLVSHSNHRVREASCCGFSKEILHLLVRSHFFEAFVNLSVRSSSRSFRASHDIVRRTFGGLHHFGNLRLALSSLMPFLPFLLLSSLTTLLFRCSEKQARESFSRAAQT